MKKIFIIAAVLITGVWAMSFKSGYCELEGEKTHQAALPIVEALAVYTQKNGIPNLDNFDQIEGIPYELKPCSERPDLMECEVLKDGYYFQIEDNHYSIAMTKNLNPSRPKALILNIAHNYTICIYTIYVKDKLLSNYLQPACSLNGKCAGWFRQ